MPCSLPWWWAQTVRTRPPRRCAGLSRSPSSTVRRCTSSRPTSPSRCGRTPSPRNSGIGSGPAPWPTPCSTNGAPGGDRGTGPHRYRRPGPVHRGGRRARERRPHRGGQQGHGRRAQGARQRPQLGGAPGAVLGDDRPDHLTKQPRRGSAGRTGGGRVSRERRSPPPGG